MNLVAQPSRLRVAAASRRQHEHRAGYVFSVLATLVAQTCSLAVSVQIVAGCNDFCRALFFFLSPRSRSGERTEERGGHGAKTWVTKWA
jgi:hypothetical protein